jgi:pyruvate dehydrogenase E1 component alpha subunit
MPEPPKNVDVSGYAESFLSDMYRRMYLVRRFEQKVNELFMRGIMPGTIHLSLGQEAVAVGAAMNLNLDDFVTPTHRGHGHAIAKGVPVKSMMAELFGKATGCSKGKGGSLHVGDVSYGALPGIAIVGAASPISAGLAFAFKRRGSTRVIVNFFGDGVVNKGDWHEAMNLAAIWKLPVVFLCENNLFGVSTHITDVTPNELLAERAQAYRMESETVFGNDPILVYQAVGRAVERARAGQGPTFVEALTYRQGGHKRDDPATYRDQSEVTAWLEVDPITLLKERLLAETTLKEKDMEELEQSVEDEITEAVSFATESPLPGVDAALEDVYA